MVVHYVIVPLTVGIGLIVAARIGVGWDLVLDAACFFSRTLVTQPQTDERFCTNCPDPRARDPPTGSQTLTSSRDSTINGFSLGEFFFVM